MPSRRGVIKSAGRGEGGVIDQGTPCKERGCVRAGCGFLIKLFDCKVHACKIMF